MTISLDEARRRCRRQSDYLITMFVTNPLAVWLTWLLLPTRITPNHVTLLSLASALACALAYSQGAFLAGAVLLFLSHVLDCVDGNLARVRGVGSTGGKLLDMVADRIGEGAIFIGVAWHFHSINPDMALLAIADGLLLVLYYYIVDIGLTLIPNTSSPSMRGWCYQGVRLKWGLMEPVIYGFIAFSLIGRIDLHLYMVFILAIGGLVYQSYKIVRWVRS